MTSPLPVGYNGANHKRAGRVKMGYSLKEAAERLGMTKPGIRYRLKVLGIPIEKDAFGRVELTEDALQWLRDGKKPESVEESGGKQEKEPEREAENAEKNSEESERKPEETGKNEKEAESGVTAALVEMLREELRGKNEQIASLTAQLENVTEALKTAQRSLEQAQILHAKSVNLLPDAQTAQTEPDKVDEDPDEDDEPTPQRKRGFLAWLLGRD